MIKLYNGDLLKSNCEIICHQVNLQGCMGGGIARQIAIKYPLCEKEYINYKDKKIGNVYFYKHNEKYYIANCFSQNENFDTNYIALKDCFEKVKNYCKENCIKTVGVPYNYGCGIANGNWETVLSILNSLFYNDDEIELQIWKL